MERLFNNSNEKSERNKKIFEERQNGSLVVDLAKKYNLSIPRVHRINMQEENKFLKMENAELKQKIQRECHNELL